jgi:hypothetical protein
LVERVRALKLMKVVGISYIVVAAEEDVVGGFDANGEGSCSKSSAERVSEGGGRREPKTALTFQRIVCALRSHSRVDSYSSEG